MNAWSAKLSAGLWVQGYVYEVEKPEVGRPYDFGTKGAEYPVTTVRQKEIRAVHLRQPRGEQIESFEA